MAIYSRSDLKSKYLNISGTNADAAIDEAIILANGWLEELCRQPIEQTAVTLHFATNGSNTIELPYTAPVAISTLEGRAEVTDSWVAYSGTSTVYRLTGYGAMIHLDGAGFNQNYTQLTLNVGWAADYPAIIKRVFAEMVYEILTYGGFISDGSRAGVKSRGESLAGVSQTTVYETRRKEWRRSLIPYTIGL